MKLNQHRGKLIPAKLTGLGYRYVLKSVHYSVAHAKAFWLIRRHPKASFTFETTVAWLDWAAWKRERGGLR